ncbi:Txe/YoeB family addiction module toxin [Pyramidobacter sp. SM-530-WT-4B]|uniref:Putative mRNA interferase YoeB n=1 Tax=Pyramidobacter porci TaxID=2605789 RepID=A0A6L5YCC8_9BACT|nr:MULTISPECIES: Txe/YoeB family addiction module toxin [Pyramidobacter]MCI6260518.1 Txe/YoeB family addiction module toxin [Pyramidobacter sp.]MST55849.1 Txe/YoeB family addiction module toxin [Pyramidobacter porci]RKJ78111.1 Txe/YoeB family addiction module toxin [Pyramidobacter sp. CG50-2]
MNKRWSDIAWDEYLEWQSVDKKAVKKINALIKDIERNGVSKGIGKPELLRYINGWSREIDKKNRLVYRIDEHEFLFIASCKGHYEE